MTRSLPPTPSFVHQLLMVLAGVFLVVMSAAFVLLPYSMSSHPGDAPMRVAAGAYHPT